MVTAPLPWLQSLCSAVPAVLLVLLLPGGMAGAGVGADALLINWSVQPVPGVGSALGPLSQLGWVSGARGLPPDACCLFPLWSQFFSAVSCRLVLREMEFPCCGSLGLVQHGGCLWRAWGLVGTSRCVPSLLPLSHFFLILCSSLPYKLERFKLSCAGCCPGNSSWVSLKAGSWHHWWTRSLSPTHEKGGVGRWVPRRGWCGEGDAGGRRWVYVPSLLSIPSTLGSPGSCCTYRLIYRISVPSQHTNASFTPSQGLAGACRKGSLGSSIMLGFLWAFVGSCPCVNAANVLQSLHVWCPGSAAQGLLKDASTGYPSVRLSPGLLAHPSDGVWDGGSAGEEGTPCRSR